jgi:hypothetical protein
MRGRFHDRLTLGPYRRRRRMDRQLRQLDRMYAVDAWGHVPTGAGTGPGTRAGRALRRLAGGVAVVAITAAGAAVFVYQEYGVVPTLDGLQRPERVVEAPTAGEVGGAHAFIDTVGGAPVTYDPCRPIEIVVNDALEPEQADGLLEEAVEEVSVASGLGLTVVGTTDEQPSRDRALRQPWRYGSGWAPVLVAWTTPDQEPDLAGDVAGIGGSAAVDEGLGSRPRLVTGSVSIDTPDAERTLARGGAAGRDAVRALLMHELGHLVGLDHVADRDELMHAESVGRTSFGPGDLEGLAAVGGGRCR